MGFNLSTNLDKLIEAELPNSYNREYASVYGLLQGGHGAHGDGLDVQYIGFLYKSEL